MLVRVRSKEGTVRIEIDPNEDMISLGKKIAKQHNLSDLSTIAISNTPVADTAKPIVELSGQTLSQLGISHGDLVFVTFLDSITSTGSNTSLSSSTTITQTQTTDNLDKGLAEVQQQQQQQQISLDDMLDKQDGLIKRERDPKFCKHAEKGMCDYCMPLEPYDQKYLSEKGIKHVSFHAYLRKINKQNKQQQTMKFIPPLEEPDFKVKTNCLSGHAPWPEGICTKCQPSAITLQLQEYRMVDHVEFSVSSLINDFIHFWRSTGYQRIGYLYGRYESYPDVPLGVKVVVEAIYEPPQEDEVDGLALTLPWNDESLIDKVATECGLTKVGVIYTDLMDDGTGQGKVICKRHIDSYFLSSQECCFSAAMQNKYPTRTKWSISGQFDSRFVTCVVTGNQNGDIDVAAYQVSNTCAAMVSADIIEPSVDPSTVRVKESTSKRYVPEVFYKYKNKYGIEVKESAKPSFPVEYLLVNVTHGFPFKPNPLFVSKKPFPIENRSGLETQDVKNLQDYLGTTSGDNVDRELLSNFHFLTYISTTGILDENDFSLLVKAAISQNPDDSIRLADNSGWQTLLTIMRVSS